jgi:hypothetical protein
MGKTFCLFFLFMIYGVFLFSGCDAKAGPEASPPSAAAQVQGAGIVSEEIRAKKFILVDENSKDRAVLTTIESGSGGADGHKGGQFRREAGGPGPSLSSSDYFFSSSIKRYKEKEIFLV